MQHPPLETIAARLSELLHCGQEDLCRPIIQHVARGKPVTKVDLQISLHLSPEGVKLVEPPGTVVTVLHPRTPVLQEMGNVEDAEANACSQQSFFASAEAAVRWLAAHPGGRIYPVGAFFERFRRNLAVVKGNAQPPASA